MRGPVHIFTVLDKAGQRERWVIPGGYCDDVVPTMSSGRRIIARTWRSDIAYIDSPAKSQDDYQEAESWLWPSPYSSS